jgi:glycosyltransferase involved in cell wall biosynthesis
MKLTLIGPSYPFKSGISHFTTILARKLREAHGDSNVDFINWNHQYPGFLYPVDPVDKDSKHTIQEPNVRLIDFYNPISWFRTAWRVRTHKSERLVVTWVSVASFPPYFGTLLLVKLFTRARITFLCHNTLPHDPLFFELFFMKLLFRLADDFIVHAEAEAGELSRLAAGKSKTRRGVQVAVGFHPNYDDFNTGETYDTAAIKKEFDLGKKVVLFFGYVRPYKGLKYLIEAMPEIRRSSGDVSLLVVGEFWKKNKPEYDRLVAKKKLQDSVVFVDRFVANEEIGRFFAVADVLAAPYLSATQSGVVQMAYSFDTPVVATRVGGLPEVIEEGVSGFLCEPKDPDSLAGAVIKALEYKKYDLAAARQRFSWEAYIRQTGLDKE